MPTRLNQTVAQHAINQQQWQQQLLQTQTQLGHEQIMLQNQLSHTATLLQHTQAQLSQREAELCSAQQRMAQVAAQVAPDLAQLPGAAQMTVEAIQGNAQLVHSWRASERQPRDFRLSRGR